MPTGPAAVVGDMIVCPMATPATPPIPHVGGPILPPGVPTVLIGGRPAAVALSSQCICPPGGPCPISVGSMTVLIGNQQAARVGDMCVHPGATVVGPGVPTVIIGG